MNPQQSQNFDAIEASSSSGESFPSKFSHDQNPPENFLENSIVFNQSVQKTKTSFKSDPELIPLGSPGELAFENATAYSKAVKEARERARRKIRRIVAAIAIFLIMLCFMLVAVTLAMSSKIDELVDRKQHGSSSLPNSATNTAVNSASNRSL